MSRRNGMLRSYPDTRTVEEGNFVLEYNFVQKKFFFVQIIDHLFIIVEGKKNFLV